MASVLRDKKSIKMLEFCFSRPAGQQYSATTQLKAACTKYRLTIEATVLGQVACLKFKELPRRKLREDKNLISSSIKELFCPEIRSI